MVNAMKGVFEIEIVECFFLRLQDTMVNGKGEDKVVWLETKG